MDGPVPGAVPALGAAPIGIFVFVYEFTNYLCLYSSPVFHCPVFHIAYRLPWFKLRLGEGDPEIGRGGNSGEGSDSQVVFP